MKIGKVSIPNRLFLAPMAGITDVAFRLICKEQGCGMVYTEMVSAKGLYYLSEKTADLMGVHPEEHPVGIQIFGSDPMIMAHMAEKVTERDGDLIDINMGCPAPKIVKNGEGSALMREPVRVRAIFREVVKASSIPVTVKIRKGWDDESVNAVEIARIAEEEGISAVTVHGRTREQYYTGKADWEIIRKVKESISIPVIGNGDVFSPQEAKALFQETGCDGIMVARGAQGNPWIFAEILKYLSTGTVMPRPGPEAIVQMTLRHLRSISAFKGEALGVREMRKHIPWYLKGLPDSAAVKRQMNSLTTIVQVEEALLCYLKKIDTVGQNID